MATHTSFHKGKRIYVVLRDGRRFVDKFVAHIASGGIVTEQHGRITTKDLKLATIYRHQVDNGKT